MNTLRFIGRLAARSLLGLAVLVAVLVALLLAAWLPFNLRDAEPTPRPAELRLPAARVPDERNAAYAFEGLLAEGGRDASATGRAMWAERSAWAALPVAQRASGAEGRAAKLAALKGRGLAAPTGPPLICAPNGQHCSAEWLVQSEALDKQRVAFGAIGERCDALAEGPFEFEELLPQGGGLDAPLMSWQSMGECSRWHRSGAMLALARGQPEAALAHLRRADRQQRQWWEGSRSLIGHIVSTRLARHTYDSVAAAALREPSLAAAMLPWLAGPLDTRTGARRWMLFEAQYQQGVMDSLRGAGGPALTLTENPIGFFAGGAAAGLAGWLSERGIGFHTERTKQKMDSAWLHSIASLQNDWPTILAEAGAAYRASKARGDWARLKWRNTFGEALSDLSGTEAYVGYLARHADHELHREATAVVLALQRERIAPAQRAAVAAKLPGLSAVLKERMAWSADGKTLTVRPWQSETPGMTADPRRDAITFAWPP